MSMSSSKNKNKKIIKLRFQILLAQLKNFKLI